MNNQSIQRFIKERDFSSLSKVPLSALQSAEQIAAFSIANFFLGNLNKLEEIHKIAKKQKQEQWLLDFISAYRAIDDKSNRHESISKLIEIKQFLASSPFLLGEFYFSLGFLFHQIGSLKLAFLAFRNGLEPFRKGKYKTHVWYINLNLLLLLRKQGKLSESDHFYEAVSSKITALPASARSRAYWHFSSILYVDKKSDEAIELLLSAISIAKKSSNLVQEQECLIDLAYIQFKEKIKSEPASFDFIPEHRVSRTLNFIYELIDLKNNQINLQLLFKIKELNLHPFFIHRIIDIFLSKLEGASLTFEEKKECLNYIQDDLLLRPMFIPFYDVDYYKLKISWLNDDYDGVLLASHSLDEKGFESYSLIFRDQYLQIQKMIKKKRENSPREKKILLDTKTHILSFDSATINLAKFPVIEKALISLMKAHPKNIRVDQFFFEVYEVQYDPTMHESRLNSLLVRVRTIGPLSGSVQRRNNTLKLSGFQKVSLKTLRKLNHIEYKTEILDLIKAEVDRADSKMIHNVLNIPMRTIQFYLKELIIEKKISKVRRGRNFVYIFMG
jgi:hypothetical protein